MSSPLFSIIIPTKNSERLIERCVESVLNQTYTEFEILVIDGASTDRTVEIVRHYKDSRIRIFSEVDRGIYDAMNKGIELSNGIWLYFLGSDDSLYSKQVLHLIAPYCSQGVDVLYGNVHSRRFNGIYDGKFDEKKILKKNICHQAIFFRRSIFKVIGYFDLRYRAHADWDHNMRWLLSGDIKSQYVDQIIADYADGGFSSMGSDTLFKRERGLRYLLYSANFLPRSKRFFRSMVELKKSLMKYDMSLSARILMHLPSILLGKSWKRTNFHR